MPASEGARHRSKGGGMAGEPREEGRPAGHRGGAQSVRRTREREKAGAEAPARCPTRKRPVGDRERSDDHHTRNRRARKTLNRRRPPAATCDRGAGVGCASRSSCGYLGPVKWHAGNRDDPGRPAHTARNTLESEPLSVIPAPRHHIDNHGPRLVMRSVGAIGMPPIQRELDEEDLPARSPGANITPLPRW